MGPEWGRGTDQIVAVQHSAWDFEPAVSQRGKGTRGGNPAWRPESRASAYMLRIRLVSRHVADPPLGAQLACRHNTNLQGSDGA